MARKKIKIKRDYGAIEKWATSNKTRIITTPTDPLMKLKFSICNEFNKYMVRHGIKQKDLAEKLGVPPNKISDLANFKLKSVSFDRIFSYLIELSDTDLQMKEILSSFVNNPLLDKNKKRGELAEEIIRKINFIESHTDYSDEFEEYDEDFLLSA